jgi:O-methyltransferase
MSVKDTVTGNVFTNAAGRSIPDQDLYRPVFSPWLGYGAFKDIYQEVRPYTLVSADRCHVLYSLAIQAAALDGQWYECGVYHGGTAMLLARVLNERRGDRGPRLHLFDTFEGMPETDPQKDRHRGGDFADSSMARVSARLEESAPGIAVFHIGLIPETFSGLEDHRIAFAHVDVDIFRSVADCCEFIHPRLVPGGFMIFDDYGFPSCPGARKAVDDFFADKAEVPLVLPTGQAIVFRSR